MKHPEIKKLIGFTRFLMNCDRGDRDNGGSMGWSFHCDIILFGWTLFWLNTSRIWSQRRSFCLKLLDGWSCYRSLLLIDTAVVSTLGERTGLKFMRALQSLLWISWTGHTTSDGTEVTCAGS